jgi:hypothetical protein
MARFIDDKIKMEYRPSDEDFDKALPKFIDGIIKDKWKFWGFDGTTVLRLDGSDYDSDATDAVVQLAIFGDVLYG